MLFSMLKRWPWSHFLTTVDELSSQIWSLPMVETVPTANTAAPYEAGQTICATEDDGQQPPDKRFSSHRLLPVVWPSINLAAQLGLQWPVSFESFWC